MSEGGGLEPEGTAEPPLTITLGQLAFVGWTMTLLAFIVVLNLVTACGRAADARL